MSVKGDKLPTRESSSKRGHRKSKEEWVERSNVSERRVWSNANKMGKRQGKIKKENTVGGEVIHMRGRGGEMIGEEGKLSLREKKATLVNLTPGGFKLWVKKEATAGNSRPGKHWGVGKVSGRKGGPGGVSKIKSVSTDLRQGGEQAQSSR